MHAVSVDECARSDAARPTTVGCYEQYLHERGILDRVTAVWAHVGRTSGAYGWKLHLSATQTTAFPLLDVAVPILVSHGIPFKVIRDSELLGMLNEGALSGSQVGKFMTVYPAQDAAGIRMLADSLVQVSHSLGGPAIQTDLHIGGVVYARYGSFSPTMQRDRLGLYSDISEDAIRAEYRVPFVTPEGVDNPFSALMPVLAAKPIRPLDGRYLLLGTLQTHAKGGVFLALDLSRQSEVRRVVLKEGRRGCLSDKVGRDMGDRLRNQAHIHRQLCTTGVVPAAGEVFEHADSFFLAVDHVPGRDLGARPAIPYRSLEIEQRRQPLQTLLDTVRAVSRVHAQGFAHRDLSMRNVRLRPEGGVMLLDFEIAHLVAESATTPFSQGTAGFVSPQQLAGEPASFADDIFALGAIAICLLTGMDPQRVIFAKAIDRAAQLAVLSGAPQALCRLIAQCISDHPTERPSAGTIADQIEGVLNDVSQTTDPMPTPCTLDVTVIDGLRWLLWGAMRDGRTGMWLSPDLDSGEHASLKLVSNYRTYRSTNRGVAGPLYTLSKLHRHGFKLPNTQGHVEKVVDWLLEHDDTPDDQMPGLHFGEAGVAVSIAEAISAQLIAPGPWLLPYIEEALSGPLDWPDLTHGAAGQGMAAIICAQRLDRPELLKHADRCAGYLIQSQAANGAWVLPEGVKAMSGDVYTGFAHGVAGMVTFLAAYARRNGADNCAVAARRGGQWLLEEARTGPLGLSLWWPLTPDTQEAWAWWCHGSPGISLAFLALYELTHDPQYAAAAKACLRGHAAEVRHANMSQCHGLSGLGEILLEAHRVLNEVEWLQRAQALGVLLANLAKTDDKGASWLVENPYQATPDLMIGTAGVVHFLARLHCKANPGFAMPLMPEV